MWKDATGAAFLKFLGRGFVRKEVADAVFLKFEHGFICGIRPAELAGRKPASIGRLRAGGPETRVNSGLAGSPSGDACFTRGLELVLSHTMKLRQPMLGITPDKPLTLAGLRLFL